MSDQPFLINPDPKPEMDATSVKLDRTINLPLLVTVVTIMFTAVWWTSAQSSRLDRIELTHTAVRLELSDRILETRSSTASRLADLSTRLDSVSTQTADQWRALDRIVERSTAADRERLAADQRLEQQIDRMVVAMTLVREQLAHLQRLLPVRPQHGSPFSFGPADEEYVLLNYFVKGYPE